MDLAAAFLLSLLGGYCFAYLWRATNFTTRRVDGHHLYFRTALCGAALPDVTRRVEWIVTAIYSLLLGAVCGPVFNLLTPRNWAQQRGVGALYRFLLQAGQEDLPVCLTLNTSKVYIGLVIEPLDAIREPVVVPLLPILSGYRDPEGRLNLTTDYEAVYSSLRHGRAAQLGLPTDWLSRFALAIRADEIVTAALFSPAIFADFNPDWQERLKRRSQPGNASATAGC